MNRPMSIMNKGRVMSLLFLNKKVATRWNFAGGHPVYGEHGALALRTVSVLRSLSGPRVPTDLLERFSSLPLLFVSGRFATFLFQAPARGGRP